MHILPQVVISTCRLFYLNLAETKWVFKRAKLQCSGHLGMFGQQTHRTEVKGRYSTGLK